MPIRWSLQQKILTSLIALLGFFGISIALFMQVGFSTQLRNELQKRGLTVAKHIAHHAADITQAEWPSLVNKAFERLKNEENLSYIFLVDPNQGKIVAHTFGLHVPAEIQRITRLAPGTDFRITPVLLKHGQVIDFAVPISKSNPSLIHVGLSSSPIESIVSRLTGEVLALAAVLVIIGALLALPLSKAIARPIEELTRASKAIALGNLDQQVSASSKDEIGQLAKAFNHMLENLRHSHNALLRSNREQAAEVARRQAAERELVSQLSFLKTLMEEMPLPVYFKGVDGVYGGCNRAFEEFFNCTKDDILGLNATEFLSPEQALIHLKVDQELLAQPGTRIYESPTRRKDGSLRQVIFHKGTFSDSQGKSAGLVGVMLDVTAEREAEQLRSEFVSRAAHEFQTPLAAIIGFSELLLSKQEFNTEEQAEFVTIINEKADYLSRLVDELLDVSRLERGRELPLNIEPCRLADLVRNHLEQYRRNHPGYSFETQLPEACPQVPLDRDRLTQVLDSILSNAVKFSPKGSLVRLRAEDLSKTCQITIEDQGMGMTEEQLEQIFNKFYRADNSDTAPSGTGLGLYIAKSIIESHGGSISAESSPGKGTRIRFTLPTHGPGSNPLPTDQTQHIATPLRA